MSNIKIALAGNPNCGKTTLFNNLTGANHYVGNWAGVTVEKKEGVWNFKDRSISVIDLPGIYSLSPYSLEERIAKDYIENSDVDLVVNVVDASFLERNLYLTTQLIELGKPVILAMNMMDEIEKKNIKIDIEKMAELLGIAIVPMIALKGKGFEELYQEIVNIVSVNEFKSTGKDFDISDKDSDMSEASKRYKVIDDIINETVIYGNANIHKLTDRIDRVLLNGFWGVPIFALVMATIFYLTFTVGGFFTDYMDIFINENFASAVKASLESVEVSPWLISLIVNGIIGGVGGVLTFVPNIAILFLAISLLEDSGYMARVAFIMDKWMSKVGLNGKSFIPMILGFGCNVPAIMGTRTLESESDRLIAILTNPFMSCGARFPVYVLFASVFFKGYEALVTFSLYALGVFMAIIVSYVFRKTLFKGEESPFLMELPTYRIPDGKSLFIHVWERVKGYITKAGTVILGASVLIWIILNFNFQGMAEIGDSFGYYIGKALVPVFKPLGFGNWQNALSLISGIVAKEIVVANTAILYGVGEGAGMAQLSSVLIEHFTPLSAYAFMVFVLLYTPCVAVIGVIKRETNSWKWTFFSVFYQILIAWTMAFLIYNIGSVFLG